MRGGKKETELHLKGSWASFGHSLDKAAVELCREEAKQHRSALPGSRSGFLA